LKQTLEDKLEAMRGPAMPAEVEARVRRRLVAAMAGPTPKPGRRIIKRASYGQLALLAVLLLTAGWVVRSRIMPTLRAIWERAQCLIVPESTDGKKR
jgi:hypothetical protein